MISYGLGKLIVAEMAKKLLDLYGKRLQAFPEPVICAAYHSTVRYKINLNIISYKYIIGIIKSSRMRWAGHVARMGKRGTCIGYW
jgi:hypothetical protein